LPERLIFVALCGEAFNVGWSQRDHFLISCPARWTGSAPLNCTVVRIDPVLSVAL